MPITASDFVQYLTETTGTTGGTNAQPDPNDSLGGYRSTTLVDIDNTSNNIFRDITESERTAGIVIYRATFFKNTNATDPIPQPRVYLSEQIAGGGDWAIGLDPAGIVDGELAGVQGAIIASETNAPAGVTFSAPTTKADGLLLGGDVSAGDGFMLWHRFTVVAGTAALSSDGATVFVEQGP